MLMLRSTVAWLLILVLAFLNGGFREAVLLPNLGKPAAFVLSGLLLSLCIVIVAIALAPFLKLEGASRWVWVGLCWLCLTLLFEFGFGVVRGLSWAQLLEAYTFKDGNIWPLVLVVTFIAPGIAAYVRRPEQGG